MTHLGSYGKLLPPSTVWENCLMPSFKETMWKSRNHEIDRNEKCERIEFEGTFLKNAF